MPAPLFSFVWQYSNQPIDVLANDVAQYVTNPTAKVLPVCADTASTSAGQFIDSSLWDDGVSLKTVYTAGPGSLEQLGFKLDYVGHKYSFGDYAGAYNGSSIVIQDSLGTIRMSTNIGSAAYFGIDGQNDTLEAVGVSATTAGAAAAKFLKVKVDNVDYKIQLLNV